jgi:hypothetical protein
MAEIKSKDLHFRCTPAEHAALCAVAARRGMTASRVIRLFIRAEALRLGVWPGNGKSVLAGSMKGASVKNERAS